MTTSKKLHQVDMVNVKTNVDEETLVEVDDNLLKVELAYIGEGFNGDYDENNVEDEPLIRFYAYVNSHYNTNEDKPNWEALEDASCCTCISKNSEMSYLIKTGKTILSEFRKVIKDYNEGDMPSVRRVTEKLSYLS